MIQTVSRKNLYVDSIFLMNGTREIMKLQGVRDAVLVMGTDMNKSVLSEFGADEADFSVATPNDLVISLDSDEAGMISEAQKLLETLLTQKNGGVESKKVYPSLNSAIENFQASNLVYISIPGEYAGLEARLALEHDKNVFIFSDNVPIEEEAELKRLARDKGLWVMGPGCGTSVLAGISVGMMSKISKGPIGIIGASGSGIHETAALIDKAGSGITQAIGTGGRDLSREVGAITMIQGLNYLMQDEETKVIVLISKPPHPESANKIFDVLKNCSKPVLIYFLGSKSQDNGKNIYFAESLEDTAQKALKLSAGKIPDVGGTVSMLRDTLKTEAALTSVKLGPGQKYIRGLFCGGTHCEEAIILLSDTLGKITSNISMNDNPILADAKKSVGNCMIDMGDEIFTRGKPHPVMEPSILNNRLIQEAEDNEVGVILFDLLLGYGTHKDPVGAISGSVEKIQKKLRAEGNYICMVASLTGTDKDPQVFAEQKRNLEAVGVRVMPSSTQAALFAGLVISGKGE